MIIIVNLESDFLGWVMIRPSQRSCKRNLCLYSALLLSPGRSLAMPVTIQLGRRHLKRKAESMCRLLFAGNLERADSSQWFEL